MQETKSRWRPRARIAVAAGLWIGLLSPTYHAQTVTDSLVDQSNPGVCLEASSIPAFDRLLPQSLDLNVSSNGNVGIGVADAAHKLTVDGVVRSLTGGFRFPDGTQLLTATPVGSPGPQGAAGPQGLPGPQGSPGLVRLNGQGGSGSSVAFAGAGGATINAAGATITVTLPTPNCTYENQTYPQGDRCYLRPWECDDGRLQGNFLTCQPNGAWTIGTLFCTTNYPLNDICGD